MKYFVLSLLLLFPSVAFSQEFVDREEAIYNDHNVDYGPYRMGLFVKADGTEYIHFSGMMFGKSGARIQAWVERHPNIDYLELNSTGGFVAEALIAAKAVKRAKIPIHVWNESGCFSTCAYIALAGTEITFEEDALLGFHAPFLLNASLFNLPSQIQDLMHTQNRLQIDMLRNGFSYSLNDLILEHTDHQTYLVFDNSNVHVLESFRVNNPLLPVSVDSDDLMYWSSNASN